MLLEHRSSHVKMATMAKKTHRIERRTDALSRERIVAAAIEILDGGGEERADRPRSPGAPGNRQRGDLLATSPTRASCWLRQPMGSSPASCRMWPVAPSRARRFARSHSACSTRSMFTPGSVRSCFASRGDPPCWRSSRASADGSRHLALPMRRSSIPHRRWCITSSACRPGTPRTFPRSRLRYGSIGLSCIRRSTVGSALDPARYPFVRQMATQLRDHDDRAQFLAGIDFILAGIGTVR